MASIWHPQGRSVGEQVRSGAHIAFGVVAGIATTVFAMAGLLLIRGQVHSARFAGRLVPWLFIVVSGLVILGTADRWARFVPGLLFLPALLKSVAGFFIEGLSGGKKAFVYGEMALYSLTVLALMWSWLKQRPKMSLFDRAALTAFAFTFLYALNVHDENRLKI